MCRPIRFFAPIRLAVFAAFFTNGFLSGTWIVHIPRIKQVLHLSEGELGVILWGAAIGLFSGMLCGNPLIGRFGSRNLCGIAAIVLALVIAVPVLSPTPWLIFAGLLLYGFFSALLDISMTVQAAYVEKVAKRQLMSSFHGFWSIGGFSGVTFGGLLLHLTISPWIHIEICTLFFVTVAIWTWWRLPEVTENQSNTGIQIAFPTGVLLPIGTVCFLSMLTEGVVADWAGILLRTQLGVDAGTAALPYAVFLISMALARFIGDRIVERFGAMNTIAVGLSTAVVGLLVATFVHHLIVMVIGFGMAGFGLGNAVPILVSAASKVGRPTVAYAVTATATVGYVGLFTGPVLIGSLAQLIQLPNAFLVVTAGVATGVMIVLGPIRSTLKREETKKTSLQDPEPEPQDNLG